MFGRLSRHPRRQCAKHTLSPLAAFSLREPHGPVVGEPAQVGGQGEASSSITPFGGPAADLIAVSRRRVRGSLLWAPGPHSVAGPGLAICNGLPSAKVLPSPRISQRPTEAESGLKARGIGPPGTNFRLTVPTADHIVEDGAAGADRPCVEAGLSQEERRKSPVSSLSTLTRTSDGTFAARSRRPV